MTHRLIIVGAGGHGKTVADAAEQLSRWDRIEFVDDRYPELQEARHWPVTGTLRTLYELSRQTTEVFIAVGSNRTRIRLLNECRQIGFSLPNMIHPRAYISPYADLGENVFVAANAVVQTDTRLGNGVIVNTSASVDHDCILQDGVHVSPGASLAGNVQVGENSWIGIGASVIQGVKIGSEVTIGAGTVVIQDTGDGVTIVGIPGRTIDKGDTV